MYCFRNKKTKIMNLKLYQIKINNKSDIEYYFEHPDIRFIS